MSLLRRNVQRRQALAVALVDDETALLRIEQLPHRIVSAIPGRKVQRTLVVVVLQIDARAQPDQVLQRPDVSLAAGIVQRRASGVVLLVQQLQQHRVRLGFGHLLGKVVQPAAVHDHQVQHVPVIAVLHADIGAQPDDYVHRLPASPRGCQQQRRPALAIERIDVGALLHQIRHDLRMVEHGGAVQRCHLLCVHARQTGALFSRLHCEHQLDNVHSSLRRNQKKNNDALTRLVDNSQSNQMLSTHLSTSQMDGRRQVVLLRGDLGAGIDAQLDGLDVAAVHGRVQRHVAFRIVERNHFLTCAAARLAPLNEPSPNVVRNANSSFSELNHSQRAFIHLEEHLHGPRAGVLGRLVNRIVAVVARTPRTGAELSDLCEHLEITRIMRTTSVYSKGMHILLSSTLLQSI